MHNIHKEHSNFAHLSSLDLAAKLPLQTAVASLRFQEGPNSCLGSVVRTNYFECNPTIVLLVVRQSYDRVVYPMQFEYRLGPSRKLGAEHKNRGTLPTVV